ncbi:MAG: T9SS type A sorting domain-containing protein, partial [Calditrichaeota bacterium]|nr:T9SS type A sorting domain-containing protein [Calditrichota bacterium]
NGNERYKVELSVYNIAGQKVMTLVNEEKPSGFYEVQFDGTALASGVYFCQFRSSGFTESRKMILMR